MDNKRIATILYETADLMEIQGEDSFRIRSYRRAAEAIESLPQAIAELVPDRKKLLEIPGIGKGMADNLEEIFKKGKLQVHSELLKKYKPGEKIIVRPDRAPVKKAAKEDESREVRLDEPDVDAGLAPSWWSADSSPPMERSSSA